MNMKPTRANRSDMPSPTFTDATTYTVTRSSPMLSSSFTPFYPRSQQQMYHSQVDALGNHDAGWYASPQDFNDVQKSYVYEWPHVREFYNQHSYTSSGSDPYKVCWVANDGNVRGGGAWQSAGNPVAEEYVYADDEADDSAYPHSDSLSYYAESPGMGKEFYACSTSNITSAPTVYPDPGITSPTAEPKMKQAATDVTKNRRAQTNSSKPSKESCFSSTDEHGLLEAVEIKHSIQATSNSTNKLELLKGSNLNTSTMPISAEVNQKDADSTNSLSPQSKSSQLLSTSGQCPDMILPKRMNAQLYHSSIIESAPLEQRNLESLLNMPSLAMEVEGKPCVEAIDPEGKMGLLPGNAWLYSNGPQLLVKCIHNLSKVLLSSQSGTSLNTLDPTDCFAIENTISILSERLYQSSMSEGNVCQDQNYRQVAEQELNISDGKLNQQKSSFLLEGMKHNVKAVSPNRVLENEALDGLSKLTSDTWVEGDKSAEQFSFVKKEFKKLVEDLLMLQSNVAKLQEDVAYERAESNVTVRTYEKLWGEAQEALKLSRLEIKELRAELASLKQEFTDLKHSEGFGGLGADFELTKYGTKTSCINPGVLCENSLDVETGSSQCFTALNFQSEASSKKPFSAFSEVMTNCFAPESISNHRENSSRWAKGEGTILRHNNQSGKRFEVSAVEPSAKHVGGTNLQDQVTQRLSLLLARQCMDLNKTDADRKVESPTILSTSLMQRLSLLRAREALDSKKTDAHKNVELPSGLSTTSSEASSNLPREGEALPLDKKGNHFISSETLYMGTANKKIGRAKVDLSCQTKPAFIANYCDYSLLQTQSNTRNAQEMDVEDVNVSTFQEDEMEIICLKPGVAEGSFACSKEEPEWEHVVVNAPVEQKTR